MSTINLKYKGYDFPMVEMGTRPEGKIWGSLYTTSYVKRWTDCLVMSPMLGVSEDADITFNDIITHAWEHGVTRWDTSIVRQWLNSDAPAGEWYKEQRVYVKDRHGNPLELVTNPKYSYNNCCFDFLKELDGFLKIVGVSKSDLNVVKNKTYINSKEFVETKDYVWIPSLSELNVSHRVKEGEPLNYYKNLSKRKYKRGEEIPYLAKFSCNDHTDPMGYYTRSCTFYTKGNRPWIISTTYDNWETRANAYAYVSTTDSDNGNLPCMVLMSFKNENYGVEE